MDKRSELTGRTGLLVHIRVGGRLDAGWSSWFDGLTVSDLPEDETDLHGVVPDQASLHGLLSRIRDLGVPLLGLDLARTAAEATDGSATDDTPAGQPDRSERLYGPRPGSGPA